MEKELKTLLVRKVQMVGKSTIKIQESACNNTTIISLSVPMGKIGGKRCATLSLRCPSPAPWSLGPANGTGVRPGPVPCSPSPGLTPGTQLPLSARQQWRSMSLLKFPPEKSNGMGGDRTRAVAATSKSA